MWATCVVGPALIWSGVVLQLAQPQPHRTDPTEVTLYGPVVTMRTARLNIQQFHVLPTHCSYVFCVDLRTNSDYFPIQH